MSQTLQVDNPAATMVKPANEAKKDADPKIPPPYHVVLLDDDHHTYDYVVRMLQTLFRHSKEAAFGMACEVDYTGRVIVETTTKERAEFKQQQIHAFGADPLSAKCSGSMSAVIEPVH